MAVEHRGQASVELALLLPVVMLVVAAVFQVAVIVRDQVHLTRATSAAARALMVQPTESAAADALDVVGDGLDIQDVSLTGGRAPGELLTIEVSARPTKVPFVGLALGSWQIHERLVLRVEGL